MKIFSVLFLFLFSINILPQNLNVELLGALNPYPQNRYSSLWGYAAPDGREYALLGLQGGTSIIDITNSPNLVEVQFIPGPNASPYYWREMKTHGHYAYIVSEGQGAGAGLQIVDLSFLPDSAPLVNTVSTFFTNAHNIFIDNGYAYVIGTTAGPGGGNGGLQILNLANPTNPQRTAYFQNIGYIHDVYVWNDSVIACAGSSRAFYLIDVTNKSNPVLVSQSASFPSIYAHSGWMSEDKRYFFGAEEFFVRDMMVFDLQDRTSWNLVVPSFQISGGSIHNVFTKGNFLHGAWYKAGYVVLDISNPLVPTVVGRYDTYLGNTGSYNGAWNCYPYFPSGKVIISDMETGLYVFDFLLDGVVPVELNSFNAEVLNSKVILNWQTATEVNNRGFEVQRSFRNILNKTNSDWVTIGFVSGNGTTTEFSNYSFEDQNILEGTYNYRLKQTDYDGKYEYFLLKNEIAILSPESFILSQNYPNPFNPATVISYQIPSDSKVSLKVFDVLGNEVATLVNEFKSAGNYTVEFNSSNNNILTSGVYFYTLFAESFGTSGNFTETKKMLLLK